MKIYMEREEANRTLLRMEGQIKDLQEKEGDRPSKNWTKEKASGIREKKKEEKKKEEEEKEKEYEETIRKLKGKKKYDYDYNDYPEEHAPHILLKKQREPRYGHQYFSRPEKDNFEYKDIYASGGIAGAGGSLNGSIDLRERIQYTVAMHSRRLVFKLFYLFLTIPASIFPI